MFNIPCIQSLFCSEKNNVISLTKCCITVLIIMILLLSILIFTDIFNVREHMYPETDGWEQNLCFFQMNDTLRNVLVDYKVDRKISDYTLYFPCGYDFTEEEIRQINVVPGVKYFIIDGIDIMTSKDRLWNCVQQYYGLNETRKLMPNSYTLHNSNDMKRFEYEYVPNKIYILKKNIQRQEGLRITKHKDDIINGLKHDYVIAQELLQDPYLINGRKINMRFYVLTVCYETKMQMYVYNDGFMYYTREKYQKNTLTDEHNITTGYIDRQVYKENPLTHQDFRDYLDSEHIHSHLVFIKIYELLAKVWRTFKGKIGMNPKLKHNVTFQLFGVDIALNEKLEPMIIEINKGPDMDAKDERDSKLKYNVMRDIFRVINCKNFKNIKEENGFIHMV